MKHIEALESTTTGTVVADSAIYTAKNLDSFNLTFAPKKLKKPIKTPKRE